MKGANLFYFKNLTSVEPLKISLDNFVNDIKGEKYKMATLQYRMLAQQLELAKKSGKRDKALIDLLAQKERQLKCDQPAVAFSVTFNGGRSADNVESYTGLIMVDIDELDPESLVNVLNRAREDPHTMICFTTISGFGVRIVAEVEGDVNAKNFTQTWQAVNTYYSKLVGKEIDKQCKNPTRLSVICHDPKIYFNLSAAKFTADELLKLEAANGVKKIGRPASIKRTAKTVIKLVEDEGVRYEPHSRNNFICRCLYWMNRFGIPIDEAEKWALEQFSDFDRDEIISITKSCYKKHEEFGTHRLKDYTKVNSSSRRATVEEVEAFLNERVEVRFNEIIHCVEIKYVDQNEWHRVTDAIESSLWREMCHNGLNFDVFQLRLILNSDFAKRHNPFLEYLESLVPWDGTTDFVEELARLVTVKGCDKGFFVDCFRRWLVAMVACVLNPEVVNQQILVFIGSQGSYKSSFMNNILPKCLRDYYNTKLDSSTFNKDDKLMLTENILINLEEIDCLRAAELNQLKAMTSVIYVNERPAYGRNKVRLPHIASFCATGNNKFFLSDDTGNRRWLAFEIEKIENPWATKINYDGLYAQLYALYKSGFRYWFNDQEIKLINKNNQRFETPNTAKELVLTHYRKPVDGEKFIVVTSGFIAKQISGPLKISGHQVGRALQDLEFEFEHTRNGNFWKVVERTTDEIRNILPEPAEDF